ncbi:TPA: SGNH/GDSL hydrolase family protein [Klebsiella aerogenes]|nr:SGNH/GDSL hydrolase family protein [Klebsiella aerogenes]HCM7941119.1 SGNH/GDSL hydrolase family protein [Klebsiella aerogenes]
MGTTTPEIFMDNVKRADELVNGPAGTVNDRGGEPLDTWREMMAKNDEVRQNIIPLGKQYMTLAAAQADIANIPVGSTTYYRSPDNSALAIEVMNVSGTLQPTGRRMTSQKAVEGIIPSLVGPGVNLFNKGAVISGFYLFEGTGVPRANPDYCYSEKISAVAGGAYTSRLLTRVVSFFDSNDNFLSDLSSVLAFTVPAGTAYFIVSVPLVNIDAYQVTFGAGEMPYRAYQSVLRNEIKGAPTNTYKSLGFATGKNLFNPGETMPGVHLSSIGTILTDTDTSMTVSGYISIDPAVPHCVDHQWKAAAYYDAKGMFISRQYDSTYSTKPISLLSIPTTAAFMRIEVPTTVAAVTMVERNDKATEFEKYCSKAPTEFSGTPLIFAEEVQPLTEHDLYGSGTNIFNKNRAVNGYINEYGSWFPVPSGSGSVYITSEYIKVAAGDGIRSNLSMRFIGFYDVNRKYLSSMTATTSVTVPESAEYIRVTTLLSNKDAMFIAKAAALPPAEGFVHVMRKSLPDGFPVRIPGDIVNADELDINFVSHGLMALGKNLFNKETVQSGYINESGSVITPDSRYVYSDYIPLDYNTAYALIVGARFIAYYNASKAFIRADASSVQALTSFVTDSTIAYARITFGSDRYNDAQVERGATATAFEEYAYYYLSEMPDGTPVKMKSDGEVTTETIPDVFGIERLRETHMRMTKMTFAEAVRLVVAMLGDSYTRTSARYVLKVAQMLWRYFNNAGTAVTVPPVGYGWRSFGYDGNGDNTDVFGTSVTQAGFTCAYNTGHGPDISSVTAAASGATISYSQNFSLGFDSFLFAEGGSGVIQYQATGSNPLTIDLTAYPAGMQVVPLSLPTTGSGTVTYTVITAPVTLYGANILNQTASGVLIHKMGGSGSHSNHWVNAMDQRWLDAFKSLGADLVTIMLGTNDQGAQLSATTFRTNILTMIDRVRSVRPTADILLVCPAENNRPTGNSIPMTTYAEVMYKVARDDRDVAFLNLQLSFGLNHEDYAAGSTRPWMIGDGLHPDPSTGGYAIAGAIVRALGVPVFLK